MSESTEQQAVIRWARDAEIVDPRLALLFAIPNEGKRTKATASRMKAEGLKAGVPDLFLAVARRMGGLTHYEVDNHGLFIEMKTKDRKPTDKQRWWHHKLAEQGYMVSICYSATAAIETIEEYLGIR